MVAALVVMWRQASQFSQTVSSDPNFPMLLGLFFAMFPNDELTVKAGFYCMCCFPLLFLHAFCLFLSLIVRVAVAGMVVAATW